MLKAKFVKEITVTDPDTKGEVNLSIYKHENGSMFAMDSSFLDQCCDDDDYPVIRDPFELQDGYVMLVEDNSITNFIEKSDLPQE
jgi:hypothetical protein